MTAANSNAPKEPQLQQHNRSMRNRKNNSRRARKHVAPRSYANNAKHKNLLMQIEINLHATAATIQVQYHAMDSNTKHTARLDAGEYNPNHDQDVIQPTANSDLDDMQRAYN